jgi:L-alanine-DL-glutamate epimerase-like enolase superfamily enzyme
LIDILPSKPSLPAAEAFQPYLDREAFGIVQPANSTSGFTEGLRIANLAAVHHRPVAAHSRGSIVRALAGRHPALVIPNFVMTGYTLMDHPLNDQLQNRSRRDGRHSGSPFFRQGVAA